MNTQLKNQLIKLSQESPYKEICGIIYTTLTDVLYYPCNNISINPESSFEISPLAYFEVEKLGKIYALFHSHVNENSDFSEQDKICAEEMELPIFCYSDVDKKLQEYRPPNYKSDLLQRPFIWGVYDCYDIVRDYYWNNYGILMQNFDRDSSYMNFDTPIINENFTKLGFYTPENQIDIKIGDVILFKSFRRIYPHHFEIFVGNSKTLQHYMRKLSQIDFLKEGLLNKKNKIIRYNFDKTKK